MAKQLKLNIKNTQIAQAINLGGLKNKLAKKKAEGEPLPEEPSKVAKKQKEEAVEEAAPVKAPAKKKEPSKAKATKKQVQEEEAAVEDVTVPKEEAPRIRARSKSVFSEPFHKGEPAPHVQEEIAPQTAEEKMRESEIPVQLTPEELRRRVFGEELPSTPSAAPSLLEEKQIIEEPPVKEVSKVGEKPSILKETHEVPVPPPPSEVPLQQMVEPPPSITRKPEKLGPTGRHVKDLMPPKPQVRPPAPPPRRPEPPKTEAPKSRPPRFPGATAPGHIETPTEGTDGRKGGAKTGVKEFRDVKPSRGKQETGRGFDVRQGLSTLEEEPRWRKRRAKGPRIQETIPVVRPTSLKIRVPISIKDLADRMKLKSSQLISKLFLQGMIVTLNDLLDDETTLQLLGQEFGCEIAIDTTEEERIRITEKSIREEIQDSPAEELTLRSPVVAFMGHVDHGKTSLIDAIRKSNRAAGEAGAITQHIGAFRCHTPVGDITVLDTPGHEAFSAMRARGADVTDIVVLVVAGDEGIRQQTLEAIEHARSANVTILVALNKSDKPGFNPENVYRQMADHNLLPEVWGGQTLTVNCSAVTGAGIKELLETLALQAEILELKANAHKRGRGTVLESEMHKGLGAVTTVLVQNGTLRPGDALVFGQHWGRVKTMRDDLGRDVESAGPSTPVAITGLSGLPEAGQEFIVVKNEREAREIADVRMLGFRQSSIQQKKVLTVENLLQQATPTTKKVLNLVLRADVQGSLEALRSALQKIESNKAEVNVIFAGVGEVSESDIQLAGTSKAVIIGFHTQVESHADQLIKQYNVQVRQHDIIYHAIDDVKAIMTGMLDKIARETDRGKAEVKALFKSSQAGVIAGCVVIDGSIHRNHHVRIMREGKEVGRTQISSLRRVKEDVREVGKGVECGIVLSKFTDVQAGDILEAYEVTYITQEL